MTNTCDLYKLKCHDPESYDKIHLGFQLWKAGPVPVWSNPDRPQAFESKSKWLIFL
jgi:hypothetical protein